MDDNYDDGKSWVYSAHTTTSTSSNTASSFLESLEKNYPFTQSIFSVVNRMIEAAEIHEEANNNNNINDSNKYRKKRGANAKEVNRRLRLDRFKQTLIWLIFGLEFLQYFTLSIDSKYFESVLNTTSSSFGENLYEFTYWTDLFHEPSQLQRFTVNTSFNMFFLFYAIAVTIVGLYALSAFVIHWLHNNNNRVEVRTVFLQLFFLATKVIFNLLFIPMVSTLVRVLRCNYTTGNIDFSIHANAVSTTSIACWTSPNTFLIGVSVCAVVLLVGMSIPARLLLLDRFVSQSSFQASPTGRFLVVVDLCKAIQVILLDTTVVNFPMVSAVSGIVINAALVVTVLAWIPFYSPLTNAAYSSLFGATLVGFIFSTVTLRFGSFPSSFRSHGNHNLLLLIWVAEIPVVLLCVVIIYIKLFRAVNMVRKLCDQGAESGIASPNSIISPAPAEQPSPVMMGFKARQASFPTDESATRQGNIVSMLPSVTSEEERALQDQLWQFSSTYEAEIALKLCLTNSRFYRAIFGLRGATSVNDTRIRELYDMGDEMYTSSFWSINHALFLLDLAQAEYNAWNSNSSQQNRSGVGASADLASHFERRKVIQHKIACTLEDCLALKHPLDYKFLLYYACQLKLEHDILSSGSSYGGNVASTRSVNRKLKRAAEQFRAIIAWTKRLWKKLLETDDDLSDFSDIVASIDKHETECDKIYKQLIMDSPSVRVYRAYAKFLAEIRKDYDLADQYLDMANMLEEPSNNVVRPLRSSNNVNGSHYSISSASSSSNLNRGPIPARRASISFEGDSSSNINNNSFVGGDGYLNSAPYTNNSSNQVTSTKKNFLAHFSHESNKITPLSAPPTGPVIPSIFLDNASLANLGDALPPTDLLNPKTATAATLADLSLLPPPVQNVREGMVGDFKTDSRINNNGGSEDDVEYKRQQQHQQTRLLRSKIQSADYSAVDRIKKTVLISLIGVMLLLTSSFIQSQILLSQYKGRASVTNLVGEFGREAIGVALAVRRLEVYRQNKVRGFAINPLALSNYATSLTSILDTLYPPSSAELTELWNQNNIPVLNYYYDPDSANMYLVAKNTTLLDAATTFQRKTFALSNNGLKNSSDFVNNTDVAFVLQNGPNSIVVSFLGKVKAYRQYYIREGQRYFWILTSQLIVSVIAIFLIVPVILIVTSRQLIEEKRSVIRMFLLIPKSTVSKIIENLDAIHGDDDDALDASTELGGGGIPNNKKNTTQKKVSNFNVLVIRYIVIVLFLFACSASFTAIGYLIIQWFQTEIAQVELSTQRRIDAFYLEMSAIEHIYASPLKLYLGTSSSNGGNATTAQILTQIAENLRNLHLRLSAGDPSYGIKSTGLNAAQKSLYYDARCSDLSNITCMSLTQLISYYTDACDSLAMIAPNQFNNVSIDKYLTIHSTENLLDPLLEQSTTIYRRQNWTKITDCTSATIVIFVLCIPLVVFFYMVPLRSSMRNLKKEGEQTREMLLLLPTNVIMETTAIYNYLMKGQQAHQVRRDIATALNQAKERTQSVLQASVDGVIEFGEDLSINIFNHSAENMLQYRYMDIVGKPVTQLFVESDGQQLLETIQQFISGGIVTTGVNNSISIVGGDNANSNSNKRLTMTASHPHQLSFVKEITAVRQDGSSFPARISLCAVSDASASTANRYTFVIFLRDITTERKQQELLIAEKKRSEDMLLNILPRSIATRLQNGETLIADSHEEVTICFIDLVQFTRMTGDLPPTKLITMLNDLTNIVDSLCERFGVEKIKTIGDAWLLASGLPLPRYDHAHAMMELGLCLLEELEKYNAEHGTKLQVRLGMNTGPVVAGVIGTRKMMYDLWGDNVNIASRMESNGVPGRIQVSRSTYSLVYDKYVWEDRGEIDVKGKGKLNAYLVVRRK